MQVLLFHSTQCLVCQAILPTLGELPLTLIDIDERSDDCVPYDLRAVPTFVIKDGDREIDRKIGFMEPERIAEWLTEWSVI